MAKDTASETLDELLNLLSDLENPLLSFKGRPIAYVLKGREPVPAESLDEAGRFLCDINSRIVARTLLNQYTVSTVFLVYDHGWKGKPLLFETMVFGKTEGFLEDPVYRYSTWDEAIDGHKSVVQWILDNLIENPDESYLIHFPAEGEIRKIRVEGGGDEGTCGG